MIWPCGLSEIRPVAGPFTVAPAGWAFASGAVSVTPPVLVSIDRRADRVAPA